ncbi:MAG: sugar transferase [Clostridia bacterium]|nr:sugar transferase [Clostridia bacterium]
MDTFTNDNINQPEDDKNLNNGYNKKQETESSNIKLPFEVGEDEEYFVEDLGKIKRKPFFAFFKRLFDFLVSLISLSILLVPFIIIAIIIKCSSKGPIFYCQERLGLNGKKFKLIKFRTMVVDAEKNGAQWSMGEEDNRIYKFGRFMRKCRIDELPQLICCLIGTMSLIGPRPERECFYVEFEKYVHGFSERLKVKPGITGLAQVSGGYDLKPQEKVLFDVEYIKKRSIWLDIKILFKTVAVVFNHKGAK